MSKLLNRAEQLAKDIGLEKLKALPRQISTGGHTPRPAVAPAPAHSTDYILSQLAMETALLADNIRRIQSLREELLAREKIGHLSLPSDTHETLKTIAEAVASHTGVSLIQLRQRCRLSRLCRARFSYYKIAHEAGIRPQEIGAFLNRDRTAVLHGLKVMKEKKS